MILSLAATCIPRLAPAVLRGSAVPTPLAEEPANDEQALVPGTRVRMDVPEGHEPGSGFHGYQWPRTSASIMVIEMPGPYSEVTGGFTAEGLAQRGMTLIELTEARICGRDGMLLLIAQKAQGIAFRKWIAMCGDEEHTLMIHATFPEAYEREVSAPMKAALLGATWDPDLELDPFAAVDWTIEPPQDLRFATEMGKNLLFTESGEVVLPSPAAAVLTIGTSIGTTLGAKSPQRTTERRARRLPHCEELEILSSTAFEHPEREGWEVVGMIAHDGGPEELLVHLVMLFEERDYAIVTGKVGFGERDTWLPRFRACAASWRSKSPPARTPAPTIPPSSELASGDELVRVPGTRVFLSVPDGHVATRWATGSGYEWPELDAGLSIEEADNVYPMLRSMFDAEFFARRGSELLQAGDVDLCGRKGRLLYVTFEQEGRAMRRWIAICPAGNRMLTIYAHFPVELEAELAEPMKVALLGARWDLSYRRDPFELLDWTVVAPQELRFAEETDSMLVFSEDGEIEPDDLAAGVLMAGASLGPLDEDPVAIVEFHTGDLLYLPTFEAESSAAVEHGAGSAWEVLARARSIEGVEVFVHATIVLGEEHDVLLLGKCGVDRREEWLPRFRACAQSWQVKPVLDAVEPR